MALQGSIYFGAARLFSFTLSPPRPAAPITALVSAGTSPPPPTESIFISNCQNILPSLPEHRVCSARHGYIPKCAKLLADLFWKVSLSSDVSRCLTYLRYLLQTLWFLDGKANMMKTDVFITLQKWNLHEMKTKRAKNNRTKNIIFQIKEPGTMPRAPKLRPSTQSLSSARRSIYIDGW